jgi:hypothetical protein
MHDHAGDAKERLAAPPDLAHKQTRGLRSTLTPTRRRAQNAAGKIWQARSGA